MIYRWSVIGGLALFLLAGSLPGGSVLRAGAWDFSGLPALGGETPADRAAFLEKTRKETTGIPVGQGNRTLWVYSTPTVPTATVSGTPWPGFPTSPSSGSP